MASLSSNGDIRIPIFNEVNYDFQRIKMRTILVSQQLWSLIEDGYEEPEKTEALLEAQKQELENTIKKDAKALSLIQSAISDEIFPRISYEIVAKSTWEILEKVYSGSEKGKKC